MLTSSVGRAAALAAALVVLALPVRAQTQGVVPLGQVRTVDGHVRRPGPAGAPVPLAHQLILLHRVGQDRAGPLDSVHTDAAGAYHFTYKTSGAPDAVYFASTRYAGIAYFTAPLEAQHVSGTDGDIIVYDTTSRGITLHLAGRHIVVSAPDANGLRDVAEVYDLSNDSSKTLIARDSVTPLWTAPLPAGAQSPAVNGGDVAPGAVSFTGHQVRLFAPVGPGIRQLAVAYQLAASAFPLSLPVGGSGMLEVLLEESSATPTLAGLKPQASVSAQGRAFKRYLAQDIPEGAVLRIAVNGVSDRTRTRDIAAIALAMAIIMGAALLLALRRRRRAGDGGDAATGPAGAPGGSHTAPAPVAAVAPVLLHATPVEQARFELARLDAAHARAADGDETAAERYRVDRAALEARIARALAEERGTP